MKVLLPEAIIMIYSEVKGVSHEMVRSHFLNYSRGSASATVRNFILDFTSEQTLAAWANLVRCSSLKGKLVNYFSQVSSQAKKRLIFNRKLLGFLYNCLNDIWFYVSRNSQFPEDSHQSQVTIGRFTNLRSLKQRPNWERIFKACVRYFHQIFVFSPNDSPSKTMKIAFYVI